MRIDLAFASCLFGFIESPVDKALAEDAFVLLLLTGFDLLPFILKIIKN